jgi:hypothetical protein
MADFTMGSGAIHVMFGALGALLGVILYVRRRSSSARVSTRPGMQVLELVPMDVEWMKPIDLGTYQPIEPGGGNDSKDEEGIAREP